MEAVFLAVVVGAPAAICLLAVVGAYLHKGDNATLIDWKPTRSPETEARLQHSEIEQMLGAVNRWRSIRGAPLRTVEELTGHMSQPDGSGRGARREDADLDAAARMKRREPG